MTPKNRICIWYEGWPAVFSFPTQVSEHAARLVAGAVAGSLVLASSSAPHGRCPS